MHFYPFIQADLTKGVLFTFVPFRFGFSSGIAWSCEMAFVSFPPLISLSFKVLHHISSPQLLWIPSQHQRVSLSRFAIIASSWLFPARPRKRREKEGERGSCRKAGGDELIWECSSIWKLITVVVDGNPCVPRKAGYCVPSLGCGGVPLDDTTVEQSQEHLIVTRWRTSGRPAHAGNALPTDFVYTQAGREIVAHIVTSVCCGACSSV